MYLLIIRHARAEDRDRFAASGRSDAQRPLTRKGIRRMTKAARGLRRMSPAIGLLVSSPMVRAVETARIIAEVYGDLHPVESNELSPGKGAGRVIQWLAAQKPKSTMCIVGHEPDLSELLEALLAKKSDCPSKLKKGSATLVRFEGAIAQSGGALEWHHTARELSAEGDQ